MVRLGPLDSSLGLGRAMMMAALMCAACGARSVAGPDANGADAAVADTATPAPAASMDAGRLDATTPGDATRGTADASATTPTVSPVDQDIAAVLQSLNNSEIHAAELATTHATNAAVRAYAMQIAAEHRASNQQLALLLTRLGITPTANDISSQIDAGATADAQQLGTLTGIQFDRTYIAQQAFTHRQALQLIDAVLIPQSQNSELRAFIGTMRTAIEAHLRQAEQLQSALGPA